jgi:hypothetical protein
VVPRPEDKGDDTVPHELQYGGEESEGHREWNPSGREWAQGDEGARFIGLD